MSSSAAPPFVVRCPKCHSDRFCPRPARHASSVRCDACGWTEAFERPEISPPRHVERRRHAARVKVRRHGNGLIARTDRLRTGEWVASVQLADGRRIVLGEYLSERGARLAADRSAHRGCGDACDAWQPLVVGAPAEARPRQASSA